jgi:hypothetical protein
MSSITCDRTFSWFRTFLLIIVLCSMGSVRTLVGYYGCHIDNGEQQADFIADELSLAYCVSSNIVSCMRL